MTIVSARSGTDVARRADRMVEATAQDGGLHMGPQGFPLARCSPIRCTNPAGAPATLDIVVTHGYTATVREYPGGNGLLTVWLRFWSSGGAAMSVALGTLLGDCLHNARRLVILPDARGRLIPRL